jgi:uncharacterized glyoxalase superfamily protein PhnB
VFTSAFPILSTRDLDGAVGFYRDLLGADVTYEFDGPDGGPAYVVLDLGPSHLGLGRDPAAPAEPSGRFALWVYAESCDAAIARLRAAGVEVVAEPADQPWGERVAQVLDPDGNLVFVGQPAAGDSSSA